MTLASVPTFQAEDGIRDELMSRGLGDVYKRQGEWARRVEISKEEILGSKHSMYGYIPVSYTHLTLPTTRMV